MAPYRLKIRPLNPGAVEWRVEVPPFSPQRLLYDALAAAAALVPAYLLRLGWVQALLIALAAALASALTRYALAVQYESVTYVRLLGVRLRTKRHWGLWSSERFLPLRKLQGMIIHEEVTPASVHFYVGLTLKPEPTNNNSSGDGSSTGSGSSIAPPLAWAGANKQISRRLSGRRLAGDSGGEVEVIFPSLRPRLTLLRQVYQQLQPLLQADLELLESEHDGARPPRPTPQPL
ncbi:hypothetical protein D9Q98_007965 [Chlorella vulgaris]|uniref:Phosphatidylinositol N-acetylglucosaminyltransferase subunit H conserved domain-containing protein n=1 Tax=Chlorella vulgaris TaxID=3077 RepID=A0A9D4THY8_CHLVU|nr:hypothetical protein D9Q98_007965 [Chlorella vulgaris]